MKDIIINQMNEVWAEKIKLAASIASEMPIMSMKYVLKNILCLSDKEINRLFK